MLMDAQKPCKAKVVKSILDGKNLIRLLGLECRMDSGHKETESLGLMQQKNVTHPNSQLKTKKTSIIKTHFYADGYGGMCLKGSKICR